MLGYRLIFDWMIAALSQMNFDGDRCDESDVAVSSIYMYIGVNCSCPEQEQLPPLI